MLVELVLCLVTILIALYTYLTRNNRYWKHKGVSSVETTFPLGIVHDQYFGVRDAGSTNRIHYNRYKPQGLKYVGTYLFHIPTLIIFDLDLCKMVLTKDFNNFLDREFTPTTHEFISKHLFALEGQEWRNMRNKLSPTFTSAKMKNMFYLMKKCSFQLQEYIEEVILNKTEFVVKDLVLRLNTDIIASCAFGLEINSFKFPENEFFQIGRLVFEPKKSTFFTYLMIKNFPTLCKLFDINFYDQRIAKTLKRIMEENVKYRKQTGVKRNDFIDLLLELKGHNVPTVHAKDRSSTDDDGQLDNIDANGIASLTIEEMTAQAFVFFAAGFETAASTTSFCLYKLAMNKHVQDRLREEIDSVLAKYDGDVSYQALKEMTYMDQVINEVLRMHASFPVLTRVCTEKYNIPNTNLVIDKGVRVHIPTYAIHHDPDIYPDPFKFDPDRFSEEISRGRNSYAFLPFGEGPRNCLGMRFGLLQVKVGLATFISKYEFSPAPGTPHSIKLNPTSIITTPDQQFTLSITKRG